MVGGRGFQTAFDAQVGALLEIARANEWGVGGADPGAATVDPGVDRIQ